MDVEVREVDGARWGDLERLFGRAGADNGCWCQYWLLGAAYKDDRGANRRALEGQAEARDAGLLAYRDGETVGWARMTPRSELGWLTSRFSRYEFPDDDPLALPCFFIARSARGSGVMRELIREAARRARNARRTLEAYPIDADAEGSTRNRFSGILTVFLDEGFELEGRLARDRVLVRLT